MKNLFILLGLLSYSLLAVEDVPTYTAALFVSENSVASSGISALSKINVGFDLLYNFVVKPWDKINDDSDKNKYRWRSQKALRVYVAYSKDKNFGARFEEMYIKIKSENEDIDMRVGDIEVFKTLLSINKEKYRSSLIEFISDYLKNNSQTLSSHDDIFVLLDLLLADGLINNDTQPIVPGLIKGITEFSDDVQVKCSSYANKIMGSNINYIGINDKNKGDIQEKFREYYYGEYLPKVKAKK